MGLLLVVLFLLVPIVEIYVIVQVGQEIGALPTVALLIVESLIGAWLVRREGRRAWNALRAAVTTGQLPSRELADAGLVLIGGTLLLTPGFVTDVVGFFFVLPLTRPVARRLLAAYLARRATVTVGRIAPRWTAGGAAGRAPGSRPRSTYGPAGPGQVRDDRVVPGEVLDPGETRPDDGRPGRSPG